MQQTAGQRPCPFGRPSPPTQRHSAAEENSLVIPLTLRTTQYLPYLLSVFLKLGRRRQLGRRCTASKKREEGHQLWQRQYKGAKQAQVCRERLLRNSHDIPLQVNAAHASSILSISLQAPH